MSHPSVDPPLLPKRSIPFYSFPSPFHSFLFTLHSFLFTLHSFLFTLHLPLFISVYFHLFYYLIMPSYLIVPLLSYHLIYYLIIITDTSVSRLKYHAHLVRDPYLFLLGSSARWVRSNYSICQYINLGSPASFRFHIPFRLQTCRKVQSPLQIGCRRSSRHW